MIMKRDEFVIKALNIVKNYKTVYMWGVFGAPVTNELIDAKAKQYPSWYTAEKIKLFKSLVGMGYFGFDCVNLIKGILWGWNGDTSKYYGGAVYPNSEDVISGTVIPDTSANSLIGICTSVSTDFSKIVPGEAVWITGHIGIYIGDGKVVECTPSWENKVQITALGNIGPIIGLHSRIWTKHGKIPWVNYDVKQKRTWPQILNAVSSSPEDWTKAITTIIDATDNAELGKLEIFHYFGTLIEKIDELKYTGTLSWTQIVDKVSSNGEEWKIAINAAIGMATAEGDLGVLETFKFIPNLIVKIYESNK